MAPRGRVIYRRLSVSDKFWMLNEHPHTDLAQLIYCLTYAHADDWGHIPFQPGWVKRTALPDTKHGLADIWEAMEGIVAVKLWDEPYTVDCKQFIHIKDFENLQKEAIRNRRRGEYPGPGGKIPRYTDAPQVQQQKADLQDDTGDEDDAPAASPEEARILLKEIGVDKILAGTKI